MNCQLRVYQDAFATILFTWCHIKRQFQRHQEVKKFCKKVGKIPLSKTPFFGANPTANPTGFLWSFILPQKVRKTPDFLSKSGVFMAYLPFVDTMHHVLKAWCIIVWVQFWLHRDNEDRRDRLSIALAIQNETKHFQVVSSNFQVQYWLAAW